MKKIIILILICNPCLAAKVSNKAGVIIIPIPTQEIVDKIIINSSNKPQIVKTDKGVEVDYE